jgi:hypothetical protein
VPKFEGDEPSAVVRRFGLTGKVVAKADETQGLWYHINHLRQAVYDLGEALQALDRKINGVKNAQADQWTESGIWNLVNARLNANRVEWVNSVVKIVLGVGVTSIVGGIAWLARMAWIGMKVTH